MLRPIDVIEFTEFAGVNAEDILMWVGKTIGKYFIEKLFPIDTWDGVTLSQKKKVILETLEFLEDLGYGKLHPKFNSDHIIINIEDPITTDERDNIMAKNVCLLFQGIFDGILEKIDIDCDIQEVSCYLLGDEICSFKLELLVDEFEESDIDREDAEGGIDSFLSSL